MELNGLKKEQLRRICQERGIKRYSNANKADLVEMIANYTGSILVPEGYTFQPAKPTGRPTKIERLLEKGVSREEIDTMDVNAMNDRLNKLALKDLASKTGMRIKGPKRSRSDLEAKAKEIGMNYRGSWSDRKLKVSLDYALLSDSEEECI